MEQTYTYPVGWNCGVLHLDPVEDLRAGGDWIETDPGVAWEVYGMSPGWGNEGPEWC